MSNSRNIADIFSKSTAISTDTEVSTAVVTERTTVSTLSGKTLLAPAMTNIIITPSTTTSIPLTINGITSQSSDYININTLVSGGTLLLKMDVNGNVGIGKTPSAKLDVNGGINGSYISFNDSVQLTGSGATLSYNGQPVAYKSSPVFQPVAGGTNVGIRVRRYSGSTANLQEWQDENGTALSVVDYTGTLYKTPLKSSLEYVAIDSRSGIFNSTYTYYANSGTVQYITSNSAGNTILNIVGDGSNTLSSLIAVGQSITCVLFVTNSTTGYYINAFNIDGVSQTVKWQGGITPSAGNANAVDAYTFTIIKTAATPTYVVLGSLTKFA
jgi:hypothetical protein